MHRFFLHGNQIKPHTEKVLAAGQVGLMNGWGVFSTLRAKDGVLFEFARHWARIRKDASAIGVALPCSESELEERLHGLLHANHAPNSTVRVVIVRNRGGMWEGDGISEESDLIAFSAPLKEWGESVSLGVQPHARYAACEFSGAKVLSWSTNLTWLERAQARGFDEVLLLNEHGKVSECTSANVFAKFGQDIITPPLSSGCLPGITRQLLLDTIAVEGYHVKEGDLTVQDLLRADASFITSSTRDVRAIRAIEGEPVSQDPAFIESFHTAFNNYLDDYVEANPRKSHSSLTA